MLQAHEFWYGLSVTRAHIKIKFGETLGLTIGIHNNDNAGMFHSQALLYLIDRQPVRAWRGELYWWGMWQFSI